MEPEPREHMTFEQTDALVAQFRRLLAGEVGISEYLAAGLATWQRGRTPYNLYVDPGWRPIQERQAARAKAAGV